MFHTPAHKQSTSLVTARAAARINIERGNDLIFPQGNERGDFSEPLWLASINGGRKFHGRTPDEAASRCRIETLRRVLTVRVYYTTALGGPLAPVPEEREFTDPVLAQRWATGQMKWEGTVGVVCDELDFRVEGDFVGLSISQELFAQVPQLKSRH